MVEIDFLEFLVRTKHEHQTSGLPKRGDHARVVGFTVCVIIQILCQYSCRVQKFCRRDLTGRVNRQTKYIYLSVKNTPKSLGAITYRADLQRCRCQHTNLATDTSQQCDKTRWGASIHRFQTGVEGTASK